MTQKTTKKSPRTVKGRNGGTLKPVQKGEVRNPKGKPKGTLNVKTVLNRLLSNELDLDGQKMSTLEAMLIAQVKKAIEDQDTSAFNAVLDRSDGKPVNTQVNYDGGERKVDSDILSRLAPDVRVVE